MVLMFLAEGFEETEAICPLDMLRRAGVDVKTVSITKDRTVKGAHGITVCTDCTVHNLPKTPPEMVVLPGGMPGANNLNECDAVKYMAADTYARGGFVAAICAAPFILGKMGLLKGRKATCYPGFEAQLEGASVVPERVVRDGNVITAVGMGAALEFGRELICALKGRDSAMAVYSSVLGN